MTVHGNKASAASSLCQSCGLCCTGFACEVVIVKPEGDEAYADRFANGLVLASDGQHRFLELPCPAFDGNCTMYEQRPSDCRSYQCDLLEQVLGGALSRDKADQVISEVQGRLRELATEYNAGRSDPLSEQETYAALQSDHLCAREKGLEKRFWQQNPKYLGLVFLREKYFVA
uniref:Putative metal-binding protein n=1 Tax=uncultured marine bacterium 463 TaxID=257394 RepID=Q6SGV7_9BACT|nr:putative metal-binding protein [uncultured marine bacterium 463]